MKNLYLLGSTGSIGKQVLEIVDLYPDDFKVITLSCNHSVDTLREQIKSIQPLFVSVGTKEDMELLKKEFPNVLFGFGGSGLIEAATFQKQDKNGLLVNALVGMVGLVPTINAIKIKRNIALANKETLVVGGSLIQKLLSEHNVLLYPIDSEHSAIWQCLQSSDTSKVKKIIITASGGAFRDLSRNQLEHVTVKDALKHPNWSMGNKITIDSATMMNKGFEIIEAAWLFHLSLDQIETVIHKESIIHSMVEFIDSSIIAQLASHDMRLPIQYALFYPEKRKSLASPLDFNKIKSLHFEEMDDMKYPLLQIARNAFSLGGSMPCVLNAANEASVDLFLKGKIPFLQIEKIIIESLKKHSVISSPTLEELLQIDKEVKETIYHQYNM